MDIRTYNRIIIVGNSGSGKSRLSSKLSEITGLPLVHLDVEYHLPNREDTPREKWILKQKEMISREKWIIEGNYNGTMEMRFEAAELVIFLYINRFVCLISAFKRQGTKRSDMPYYHEEKRNIEFYKWALQWIVHDFPKFGKRTIFDLHKKYPEKPFIIIKRRKSVKVLLKQWENETAKYL